MPRLPFNPDRVRGPEPAAPAARSADAGPRALTVSQLTGLIRTALADGLPPKVRVVGEVSNFSNRQHWFFSLKDEGATLRCVCFASNARRIRCPVQDGMQVVATGRIDFYDAQGHVQLYVDNLEPVGQGALELRLRQLIDELRKLGYFDEARKRPLPVVPQRVAVVTSRSAAALQDVINTAHRRWPGCQLLLYDVRVQGEAAAPEIAAAIKALSKHGPKLGIDAIILTRGGGSIEDLWAFNERIVADALYHCPIPVVAAIGHETDVTVAELVADLRCATPTQAAMKLIPDRAALEQELRHWSHRLTHALTRQLRHARHRLDGCARRGFFRRPMDLVDRQARRVDELQRRFVRLLPQMLRHGSERLGRSASRLVTLGPRLVREQGEALARHESRLVALGPRLLRERRQRLDALARHLEAVSPRRVLERGYSMTLDPRGQLVRRAADVKAGDTLTTLLADGQLTSRVEGGAATPATASPAPTTRRPRRRARTASGNGDQPTLF